MVTKAIINNKKYKVIDQYGFKSSNSEVTFNEVKIDFTGHTSEDIPFKYQEIKIEEDGDVKFTGYLDSIDLSHLTTNNKFKEMTLTLLSPLKMATKRNISLIGIFVIRDAITRILQPLIDDGFILKEMNVPNSQISVSFVLETIENAMNNIGFKRNIFWYINEKKEIFVNSIDYLFGQKVKKTITTSYEKGLLELQPTIENIDYANIINFKNVRLIYSADSDGFYTQNVTEFPIIEIGKKIKKGDIVTFKYPIILDETILRSRISEINEENRDIEFDTLKITIKTANSDYKDYSYGINLNDKTSTSYNKYIKSGSITFNDDGGNEGDLVLQRDSFFSNLITGFKWNGDSEVTIFSAKSDTALRYTTMKFLYSEEIEKLKGIISKSGQIEKVVDFNEKWTTLPQLISYARSLMVQNSNIVNEAKMQCDINPNLKIGDIVEINRPNYFLAGKFAVKDIEYTYTNKIKQNWNITLKSTDLISTYLDLFRPAEVQQNEGNIDTVVLSEFTEESFKETHSIEMYESDEDKVIRLAEKAWIDECGSLEGCSLRIETEISDNYYLVSARDFETTAAMAWIYVNIVSETVEIEW